MTSGARQRARNRYLLREYGITTRQFNDMIRIQRGKCRICRWKPKPGKRLQVDHDHKTKRVRGGLCLRCNYRLLGRGLERADLHIAAARYLRSRFDARRL